MIIDRDNLDGVARKLLYQCEALGSYSENDKIYLASFVKKDVYRVTGPDYDKTLPFEYKNSRQLNLFQIYPKLSEICRELKINAVYFRVFALSWVTDKLFKQLKKMGIKIIIEIPTYPFWKEKWMDVLDKVKTGKIVTAFSRTVSNITYWIFAHRIKKYVHKIVTFSDIKRLWGVDVIGIANGYAFKLPKEEKQLKDSNECLNLIMVASVRDNHGADRVINGLNEYYSNGNSRKVVFHIVGDGDAIPNLKALAANNKNVSDKVVFHGFRAGEELENLYKTGDIGVSAIAFHRLGVTYCSPLKSKEYFAKGIPVVGTVSEKDIINSESGKFYFAIPSDDSYVDIKAVCEFYDNLRSNNYTNKDITATAAKNFDWKSIMLPIYKEMLIDSIDR